MAAIQYLHHYHLKAGTAEPILRMRELRLRDVESFAWSNTALCKGRAEIQGWI